MIKKRESGKDNPRTAKGIILTRVHVGIPLWFLIAGLWSLILDSASGPTMMAMATTPSARTGAPRGFRDTSRGKGSRGTSLERPVDTFNSRDQMMHDATIAVAKEHPRHATELFLWGPEKEWHSIELVRD